MAGSWDRPRSADSLTGITGTVLWAPLSVLEGGQHSVSSMLEGLFISALSISCNGKLETRHDMNPNRLQHCAYLRRGHLCKPKLPELSASVQRHLSPLIAGLHNLFYPLGQENFRGNNCRVTVQMVHDVCTQACGPLQP